MKKRLREIAGRPRHVTGWRRGPKDGRDKLYSVSWLDRIGMPSVVSLRGKPGLTVENQESIGSCTCNAGSSALEFVTARQSGSTPPQLSRLWLYAKVREFEGTPLGEDSGAFVRDVMKVLAKFGCPEERLWPYLVGKYADMPPSFLDGEAAKHKVALYYRCPTLGTIRASIAQGFPVVGGFDCPENLFSAECARTGVVKFPAADEGFEGGHAVLFTGYDDKLSLLEFMNSWGEGWGDFGFGRLPYDFVRKCLADDFFTERRAA